MISKTVFSLTENPDNDYIFYKDICSFYIQVRAVLSDSFFLKNKISWKDKASFCQGIYKGELNLKSKVKYWLLRGGERFFHLR